VSAEQGRRVGLNESLFRQVNEQIQDLNRTFGSDMGTMTVVCECADADCAERLEVPVAAYERVRSDPLHYIVTPGHEIAEFESVVERKGRYDVVRKKNGAAVEVAKETDPRS
jgi:hypothetical protein